mgnify:CR=1 FL=1
MGLSTADMKNLTFGIIIDLFIEKGIDAKESEDDGVIEATQADFDRF